jgi:hypothetical protein
VAEIFLQSIDPKVLSPSILASPLVLGQICRKWHQISVCLLPHSGVTLN